MATHVQSHIINEKSVEKFHKLVTGEILFLSAPTIFPAQD